MIAASDPQEFIPGGRQQAHRHPDPPEFESFSVPLEYGDDFLLHRLERVKINESPSNEWWALRKSIEKPKNGITESSSVYNSLKNEQTAQNAKEMAKSFLSKTNSHSEMLFNDSWTPKSFDLSKKRISDITSSRLFAPNHTKRLSSELDNDLRSEIKGSGSKNAKTAERGKTRIKFRSPEDTMEEELYVKGNLVVWSRGLSYNDDEDKARNIICCYSSYFPLKDAVWCTFQMENQDLPAPEGCVEYIGEKLDCLCIADTQNLRVYAKDDEDFITTLPFQVRRMWPTRFGICIERDDVDAHKEPKPMLYTMTHPLDIAAPVMHAKGGSAKLIQTERFRIVFTSEALDVCMIFDEDVRQHSICRFRRIRRDELEALNKTGAHPSMSNTKSVTAGYSMTESYRSIFQPGSPFSRPQSTASNHFPSFPSRGQSPITGQQTFPTTTTSTTTGGVNPSNAHLNIPNFYSSSRCNTPQMNNTPGGKKSNSPWLQRDSRLHSTLRSCDASISRCPNGGDTALTDAIIVNPIFCLEHIWNEGLQDVSVNSPATNVFTTEDLMGRSYLCYLVPSRSQLFILKFNQSNNSDDIVFGKVMSISAKDAVTIPHLRMLAILEHTSNVMLYSGLTVIGKLHIGGTLAQHLPSPYAIKSCLNSKQFFNSPFPRRSSLLPTSTPGDPRFDEHLLSPVLPANCTRQPQTLIMQIPEIGEVRTVLSGLKDAIDNRLTLQYSDGSCYRVTLPNMVYSQLVEDCLNALRIALPIDLVMTTLSRWYAARNLPGNVDISLEEEWRLFTKVLYELLGYFRGYSPSVKEDNVVNLSEHTPTSSQVKRQRQSVDGTVVDWNYLRKTTDMSVVDEYLQFSAPEKCEKPLKVLDIPEFSTPNVLFSHIRIIHYVLHLVYENLKLNTLRKQDLPLLGQFLSNLAHDIGLEKYLMHYWIDFPANIALTREKQELDDAKLITKWPHIPETPTSIMAFIYNLCGLDGMQTPEKYPVIDNINTRSKQIVHLLALYLKCQGREGDLKVEQFFNVIAPPGSRNNAGVGTKSEVKRGLREKFVYTNDSPAQKVVLAMIDMEMTTRMLETFPLAVNFILYDALWRCRDAPPTDWPAEAYKLLQRLDLASQADIIKVAERNESNAFDIFGDVPPKNTPRDGSTNDGMEDMDNEVLKLRFADDQRVLEVRNLLQSSKPVPINVVQRPDVSDHDHLEEQEKQLYAICTRTMALPVGRGMFTLHTSTPIITEPLPVPPLCLTGKAYPRGTTVELTHIDTPSNMAHWPQFHNGVANGLRINPSAKHVDSTWIVFNKPKGNAETMMEHAGFLMALGLNGHLKNLAILNRFDYLKKVHEMTSVGILLGLGAAFRGTSNAAVTKMLSVHVEGLLPPTSIELDVPQNLQVASLLGVGLIYQGTAHRRMIEVMLTEIGRPPGPEMENSVDRQSYSLAAGLALGLITLRQGGASIGLSDLKVPDTLHYYMVGGSKRPLTGTQKEKYKVSSFQIREGSTVNLDVTAPGATLALGLMYLGTGNKAIAGWMAPPDTHYLLDFVRPDFLMLRTLCRALILWAEIEPTKAWIEGQVPDSIRPYCIVEPNPNCDLDYEAMNQAYCNIIAGACFAIGLKYAGTAQDDVYKLLLEYCLMFASLTSKTIAELAGKPTMETCLNVVLISLSMVMAGTGNIDVIRMVRYLRQRVGLSSSAVVTYGSHMALHMALGLLFLGGGRYTLSNSPASVAALICAFYPKFPTHSNDNRYHLQAFRHLYVLAAEPRLVIPADIVTGRMCYANLQLVTLNHDVIDVKAPELIPDLNTLYKVSVHDVRYWPVVFERERNWDQLLKVLSSSGHVDVKQRAGCLSYNEDKTSFRTELARTLTKSDVVPWDPPAKSILSFSSDTIVRLFADQFLTPSSDSNLNFGKLENGDDAKQPRVDEFSEENSEEVQLQHAFTQITYESVIKDKLAVLPLFVQLIQIVRNLATTTTPLDIWHLKIIHRFVLSNNLHSPLLNNEQLLALHQKALTSVDNWEAVIWDALKAYLTGGHFVTRSLAQDGEKLHKLAKYITFYGIPHHPHAETDEILEVIAKLQEFQCDSEGIDKVLRVLGYVR